VSRFLDPEVSQNVNPGRAKRTYRANLTSDRTISEVGEVITIFGGTIANSSGKAAEVDILDGDGDTLFTLTVPTKNSTPWPAHFTTSGGVVVDALTGAQANDVFVSVFYTDGVI